MQASSIIELNGRGIPAVLHTAKIVDVCAYLKSNSTPAALVLSDRGEVRGVMSKADIIGAAGRLGSSVMQMMAGELMREQAPVCQSDTAIVELLEILSETSSDFVLVTEGGVVKGLITFQDVAELLTAALSGGDDETGHAVEADAAVADHAVAGAPAGEAVPRVEMPASEPAPQAEIPAAAPAETPLAPPQQAQMADAGQMPPVHPQPAPQQGLEIAAQPTQPMVAADHAQYAPAPEPVAAVHAAAPVMPHVLL
jgi:CBS domain-containing protein